MKKTLCVVLVALLTLSMAGCTKEESQYPCKVMAENVGGGFSVHYEDGAVIDCPVVAPENLQRPCGDAGSLPECQ